MRTYTVHLAPGFRPDAAAGARAAEVVLVREGFSFPAFLFTGFWALFHRLWLAAALILAVTLALTAVEEGLRLGGGTRAALGICFSLGIGFFGPDWRRAKLAKKGWRDWGVIAADDEDAALRRFWDEVSPGGGSGFGPDSGRRPAEPLPRRFAERAGYAAGPRPEAGTMPGAAP